MARMQWPSSMRRDDTTMVSRPEKASSAPRFPLDHPLVWLLLLALAHVALRVALSPALRSDEAEQILWSQQLLPGYGAQPPLYTWLQWGVNQVLGPSVLALSLLKHTLLALACVFMWLAARELLDRRAAWWVAGSLMLLPAFSWFSIRDQTHTVLVTTLACATWWLLLRVARQPQARDFAWLGLVCGAGVLAKYNFALLLAALLVTVLTIPVLRSAVFSRGWWLAPLMGALVLLPHAGWLLLHWGSVSAETLTRMNAGSGSVHVRDLLALIRAGVGSFGLWAALALWAFGSGWWGRSDASAAPAWARPLFLRYLGLITLAFAAMVLLLDVSHFKSRWVLPLVCVVPLAAFALRPQLQAHPRGARFTWAIVACVLALLVAAGGRPWLAGARGHVDHLAHPVAELGAALRAAGYDGRGLIVSPNHRIAAALRIQFPQAPAAGCNVQPEDAARCVQASRERAHHAGLGWLLIADAQDVPDTWWQAARSHGLAAQPWVIELPYHMVPRNTPPGRYTFVWQPPESF